MRLNQLCLIFWCLKSFELMAFTVVDVANGAQNVTIIANQILQLERMAEQIKREVEAAQRLMQKMKKLDITKINDLVSQISSFRSRARSIGYTYESVAHQFDKTYGRSGDFSKNFKAWQKQSDDSLKDAMVAQGLLQKSEKHMADLEKIVDMKRKGQADGDTLQAIGEINAIQSKQLADLSQIIATDARAQQSVLMEKKAQQKEQQNYENHLMKDFNKHGKSRPLTHFPSLGTTAPRR